MRTERDWPGTGSVGLYSQRKVSCSRILQYRTNTTHNITYTLIHTFEELVPFLRPEELKKHKF